MSEIRPVTPSFAVTHQQSPDDMAELARRGFAMVINNRPDGETPDQPASAEIAAAAKAAGLDYRHIPFAGRPGDGEIEAVRAAIAEAKGPVLSFCRSGTRSITAWALGKARAGEGAGVLEQARAAGYDLSGVLS